MSRLNWLRRATGGLLAALALMGCAGTGQMSQQQREGVELRRHCEQNPQDVAKCIGFLGFI